MARSQPNLRQIGTLVVTAGSWADIGVSMVQATSLSDYHAFLIKWLRRLEVARAKGDPEKLEESERTSDAYLIRKWLWMITIVGAPIVYLIVPFVLSFLHFLPTFLFDGLWMLAKGLMGIIFVLFLIAMYATLKGNFEQNR